jgi:hypothetical protein
MSLSTLATGIRLAMTPPEAPAFERFEDALKGAELLLDFAARNGIKNEKLDEKEFSAAATNIAATKEKYDATALTPVERSNFYEVYWKLAQLMQPVSVNSIRDSYPSLGERRFRYRFFGPLKWYSQADIAVDRWKRRAVLVLIALLVVQVYWVTGAALIEGIKALDSQPKAATATSTPTPSPAEQVKEEVKTQIRRDTLYRLLDSWWQLCLLPPNVKRLPYKQADDPTLQTATKASSLLECCTQVVNVLQVYILPLLYGLLGAHAYVLRELIRENRERVFRTESETAYRMRIILGLLAGLAIGWFARPDPASSGIVAKLGPFALSFLAGYSVEVLFSAMDRFVSAFGSVSQQSKS